MILKGSQRGGAKDLALHLMKDENDHIDVHELRGFCADDLMGALNETYAISRGTQCKKFLYSLSLNPPQDAGVSTAQFEATIDRIENKLGLTGQPRAIVFHEKEGPGGVRRHAHAVWSRIDGKAMKAVHMPFDHERLMAISRELYLEHGWKMPDGLANPKNKDPRNYTLAEYQQAKRAGKDARDVKGAIQDAWAISDSKVAFEHALEERGYKLARGDRRGFVAVDTQGEVYAVPKMANIRTKAVRESLGDEKDLLSVDQARAKLAEDMAQATDRLTQENEARRQKLLADYQKRKAALIDEQRAKRSALTQAITLRQQEEARERQARFRKGLGGVWDRLRGEHGRIKRQNEQEAKIAQSRDRAEKDRLIQSQLNARKALRSREQTLNAEINQTKQELNQDRERHQTLRDEARAAFLQKRQSTKPPRTRRRGRDRDPGPSMAR